MELPLVTHTFHNYTEHQFAVTVLIGQTCSKSEGRVSVIIQDIKRKTRSLTSVEFTLQTKLAEVVTVELPLLSHTFHYYNEYKVASIVLMKQVCSIPRVDFLSSFKTLGGRLVRFTLQTEIAETLK